MIVTHTDSEPLATGTHKGIDGSAILFDPEAYFKMCGVREGLAIYKTVPPYMLDQNGDIVYDQNGDPVETNEVDENGLVLSTTEEHVTASGITAWTNGDTYEIYKTGVKDSFISSIGTDRSRGWKVTSKDELDKSGWFSKDHDIDKDENGNLLPRKERPFGPGQPERNY